LVDQKVVPVGPDGHRRVHFFVYNIGVVEIDDEHVETSVPVRVEDLGRHPVSVRPAAQNVPLEGPVTPIYVDNVIVEIIRDVDVESAVIREIRGVRGETPVATADPRPRGAGQRRTVPHRRTFGFPLS
jgi:hypothetical protein